MADGRKTSSLQNEINLLKTASVHDSTSRIKDCLAKIYSNELEWLTEVEELIKGKFGVDINENNCTLLCFFLDYLNRKFIILFYSSSSSITFNTQRQIRFVK